MTSRRRPAASPGPSPRGTTSYPLAKLLLDKDNARFGSLEGKTVSQADILDHIVEKFGVDDVLSSLAVNGYFQAEPLVCRRARNSELATVVEGNRRLAACLIITGDDRASRQANRTEQYRKIWEDHGSKPIDPVPVILFDAQEQEQELLSYLGVRHIAAAQPWDSYAKAAWVARIVEQEQLSVADVALMIGDQYQTVRRLLQGYYFIKQLIDVGEFRPEDSIRKGRGSVSEYPFSWVYTILGYSTARSFVGIDDERTAKKPVAKPNLPKAALVVKAMFGDRSKGKNAAITDSRQIGDLASALADPVKVSLLEQGKTIDEILRLTQPIEQRLRQGLAQVRELQADLLAGIAEQGLAQAVAEPLVSLAGMNRRTAAELERKIKEAATGEARDD